MHVAKQVLYEQLHLPFQDLLLKNPTLVFLSI